MKTIHVSGFSPRQRAALDELASQLGLLVTDRDGILVKAQPGDALSLTATDGNVLIMYQREHELFRALSYLPSFLETRVEIREHSKMDTLCYMADNSRNSVMTVDAVKRLVRHLALMGYDSLMLYTEDTFDLPGYPYFGHMRGKYTEQELRAIDDYADLFGIEVIPCVQTLAHLETALRWPEFGDVKDTAGILLVGEERTYDLITAILRQCRKCFRSKRINIGMDEAHMLGRGTYLQKNGYRDAPEIMLEHLARVVEICKEFDFAPMIWSDMFFQMAFGKYNVREGWIPQEIIDRVPPEVTLIYWDYYTMDPALAGHMQDCHLKFHNPVAFAGGAWRWSGFGAHNAFSIESTRVQLDACEERGIGTVLATAWSIPGSDGSQFSVLASTLYYAERRYAAGKIDNVRLNQRALACTETSFDDLMKFDLPDLLPGLTPAECWHPMGVCRYLLYNDPLERLMDSHLHSEENARLFAEHADALFGMVDHPTLGYAYEVLAKLCRILTLKCDLGSRLCRAYRAEDSATMQHIATDEIPQVIEWLDDFILALRRQWYIESKPFGFTTQDYRLGGLRERLRSTADRIHAYLGGEIQKIDELEIDPLPLKLGQEGQYLHTYGWLNTVMAGRYD